jgi:hypothetical protein
MSLRHMGRILLVSLVVAGCGPPWLVVRQSGPPSALRAVTRVTVFFDASQALVDGLPIAEELARLSPDERADLDRAMRELGQTYVGELAASLPVPITVAQGPPAPGEVRCLASVVTVDRGGRGPLGRPTRVALRLDWSVDGQITDAVVIEESVDASVFRPSVAQRLRVAGGQLAHVSTSFFQREQSR